MSSAFLGQVKSVTIQPVVQVLDNRIILYVPLDDLFCDDSPRAHFSLPPDGREVFSFPHLLINTVVSMACPCPAYLWSPRITSI